MKVLLVLPFVVALLSACPDSKIPKPPLKIPEPKAIAMVLSETYQNLACSLLGKPDENFRA